MRFRMRTGAQSTSIHFKPPLEVDCAEVDSIHYECALAPMRIECEISQCALNAHSMRIGFQCEKAFSSHHKLTSSPLNFTVKMVKYVEYILCHVTVSKKITEHIKLYHKTMMTC